MICSTIITSSKGRGRAGGASAAADASEAPAPRPLQLYLDAALTFPYMRQILNPYSLPPDLCSVWNKLTRLGAPEVCQPPSFVLPYLREPDYPSGALRIEFDPAGNEQSLHVESAQDAAEVECTSSGSSPSFAAENEQDKQQEDHQEPQDPMQPPWFLGRVIEELIKTKPCQLPKWEDVRKDLTTTMSQIEHHLRRDFERQTGVIIHFAPTPASISAYSALGEKERARMERELLLEEYTRQGERVDKIWKGLMEIEQHVNVHQNVNLLRIKAAQFSRIELALHYIHHILDDSPFNTKGPALPVMQAPPHLQFRPNVVFPPNMATPSPSTRQQRDYRSRMQDIEMAQSRTHFSPIRLPANQTTEEFNEASSDDSGVPHSPPLENDEIVRINAARPLQVATDSGNNESSDDASSQCSTSRESSPLTIDEINLRREQMRKRQQFKASVVQKIGADNVAPRRMPQPISPQRCRDAASAPPDAPSTSTTDAPSESPSEERHKRANDEAHDGRLVYSLLLLTIKTRGRKQHALEDYVRNTEKMRQFLCGDPPTDPAKREAHNKRHELLMNQMHKELGRRAMEEFRQMAKEDDEMLLKYEQGQWKIEQMEKQMAALEREEKEWHERQRRMEEEDKRAAFEKARMEQERRRKEEEQRIREKKEEEERERLRMEQERIEEEEREERARREKQEEEERMEAERVEQERQLQQLDRETRKAEERRKKQEDEERKRMEEEEKRRRDVEKRREIEKRKLEEAMSLEEIEREAAKKESERKRLQREEDAERRREEQRKLQAIALQRQQEEEARQALSFAEKFKLEEEEKRRKMEELQNALDSQLTPPSTPEQQKTTNKAARRRAKKTGSRLQSTESVDGNQTRDASRESEQRIDRGSKTKRASKDDVEYKVHVTKLTKKRAEEVKFQGKTYIPVAPELNGDDKRAAEKRKAFLEQQAKEAKKMQRREQETRASREVTPLKPQTSVWRRFLKKDKRPGFSSEFMEIIERNKASERFWANVVEQMQCFFTMLVVFAVIAYFAKLVAPTIISRFEPERLIKEEKQFPSSLPPLVLDDPLCEEDAPDEPTDSATASSSNRPSIAETEELQCLLWVFKPGPEGASLCVRIPQHYHLSKYHDDSIVTLADQESTNFIEHLLAYESCEASTGYQLFTEFDEKIRWWTGNTLNISQQTYSEDEAAIAHDMLTSPEMGTCFHNLCVSNTSPADADAVFADEKRSVYCFELLRVISRLSRIAYFGWGEEKLMSTHKRLKNPWFSLRYPYKNATERNTYVTRYTESFTDCDLCSAEYDIMSIADVPLPLIPRQYSEQQLTKIVRLFYKSQNSPAGVEEWVKWKTMMAHPELFDATKAQKWIDLRLRVLQRQLKELADDIESFENISIIVPIEESDYADSDPEIIYI